MRKVFVIQIICYTAAKHKANDVFSFIQKRRWYGVILNMADPDHSFQHNYHVYEDYVLQIKFTPVIPIGRQPVHLI